MELLCLTVFLGGLISCEVLWGAVLMPPKIPLQMKKSLIIFTRISGLLPLFQHKNALESVYEIYRPSVDSVNSQEDLFDLLEQMIYQLKDGHIVLESPFNRYQYYDWYLEVLQQ